MAHLWSRFGLKNDIFMLERVPLVSFRFLCFFSASVSCWTISGSVLCVNRVTLWACWRLSPSASPPPRWPWTPSTLLAEERWTSLWEYLGNANCGPVLLKRTQVRYLVWRRFSQASLVVHAACISFTVWTCLGAVLGGENMGDHVCHPAGDTLL